PRQRRREVAGRGRPRVAPGEERRRKQATQPASGDAQKSGPSVRGARRHYTGVSHAEEAPRRWVEVATEGVAAKYFWGETFAITLSGFRIRWRRNRVPGQDHLGKIG